MPIKCTLQQLVIQNNNTNCKAELVRFFFFFFPEIAKLMADAFLLPRLLSNYTSDWTDWFCPVIAVISSKEKQEKNQSKNQLKRGKRKPLTFNEAF